MRYLVSQITLFTLITSPLLLSRLVHAKATITVTYGDQYVRNSTDGDSTDVCKEECKNRCVDCQHPKVCDTYNRRYDETKNKTYANGATERLCSTEPAKEKFEVTCPAVEKCEPITNKCADPPFKPIWPVRCNNDPLKCPGVKPSKVQCEGTKIVTCDNATQIFCAGLKAESQCTQADTCEELESDSDGKICPGVCPKTCKDDAIKCVKPTREGCPDDSICVAKSDLNAIRKDGNPCPKLGDDDSDFCTPVCKDTQILCKGPIDEKTGCKLKIDQCVERGTGKNNTLCPGTCEKECPGVTQIKCKGTLDNDGCPTSDYCTEKLRDTNNAFCLDTSDSHGCPVDCPENQVDCEPKRDALGCKEKRLCYNKINDNNGNECPKSSICPTPCESNQISCPGGMEENGCPKPDLCVEKTRSVDGNVCPNNCPALCDDDQIKCPGHTEKNGCKSAETCHFRGKKSIGNDVDGLCPGYCPAVCKFNEIKCASQIDCDGCFTQELCKPKATNQLGQACPPESASHECPLNCDANNGQTVCVSEEDEFGCKPKARCVQRQKDNEGKWCPSADACPEKCLKKLQLDCPGGFDQRGCKQKNMCKDRYITYADFETKKNYNNEKKDVKIERLSSLQRTFEDDLMNENVEWEYNMVCANHCPALCDPENEYQCNESPWTERSCPGAPTCHRKLKDLNRKECTRRCPIKCGKNEIMLRRDVTALGCPGYYYCQRENTHWQADSGLTCFEFAENKWCENGGVGSAWNDSWTWDKDSEGLDARDACLVCGAKEECKMEVMPGTCTGSWIGNFDCKSGGRFANCPKSRGYKFSVEECKARCMELESCVQFQIGDGVCIFHASNDIYGRRVRGRDKYQCGVKECSPVVDKTNVNAPVENQDGKTAKTVVDKTDATATITDQTDAIATIVNQAEVPKTVVDQTDAPASNVDQSDVTTAVVDSQDDATVEASADVPTTTEKAN